MAFGVPVVAFDLEETVYTAGSAGSFVADPTSEALATRILELADDEEARKKMGETGRKRIRNSFLWRFSRDVLVRVYSDIGIL